jgi:uncharacterized SAM-binding protein YcdF (DUF218 family)
MKIRLFKFCSMRLVWLILIIALFLISFIPVRLAITLHQVPTPQAIFVLGGDFNRTEYAARFWQSHQNLDIWVSDFSEYLEMHRNIFLQSGIPIEQLHLDGRATDTVTNFTSLVGDFVSRELRHIYLITSDYHIRRSRVIATMVLGSRGIVVTPVTVPSTEVESESWVRVLRDFGRCVLWVVSGKTGASLNPRLI